MMITLLKQLYAILVVVGVAMGVSCAKAEVEEPLCQPADGEVIEFFADEIGGRTAFGESTDGGQTYPTLWKKDASGQGEQLRVTVNLAFNANNRRVLLKDPETNYNPRVNSENGVSASFKATLADFEADSYTFYAVCPGANWLEEYDKVATPTSFRMKLPAEQTPVDGSCDASAQLIVAKSATSTERPVGVSMQFKHIAAYGLLSLKNIEGAVSKVVLKASKNLAGNFFYDVDDEAVTFNTSGVSREITLTTSRKEHIWFALIPVDLSENTLTCEVTTDRGVYTKIVEFDATKGNFKAGRIAKFSIDFDGVAPVVEDKFVVRQVYKENGVAQGVVFWVSPDGLTAKIVSLTRCAAAKWWSTASFGATGATDQADGAPNMIALSSFLETNADNGVKIPMVEFCEKLGAGWYWPAYDELRALAAAYHGVGSHGSIKRKQSGGTDDGTELAAQQEFDKLLTDNGGVALNTGTTSATNGDRYWSSTERSTDYSGKAAHTLTGYAQFGLYNATLQVTKTSYQYFGRAIKVVKKAGAAEPSVASNVRYGAQRSELAGMSASNIAGSDRLMDIYTPGTAAPAEGYPMLLYVHGGGFRGNDKAGATDVSLCMAMAKKGYVVCSINYYLGLKHENSTGTSCTAEMAGGLPASGAYTPVMQNAIAKASEDAAEALRYMKSNAATYRINPNKMAVSGGSAGAITVLHLAYVAKPADLPIWGVVDLWGAVANPASIQLPAPPMIIYHGDKDELVNVDYAHALEARLKELNVKVKKNIIVNGAHAAYAYVIDLEIDTIDTFLKSL